MSLEQLGIWPLQAIIVLVLALLVPLEVAAFVALVVCIVRR